jgi:hypothetical protein
MEGNDSVIALTNDKGYGICEEISKLNFKKCRYEYDRKIKQHLL